jgi:hypothetical protein
MFTSYTARERERWGEGGGERERETFFGILTQVIIYFHNTCTSAGGGGGVECER